MPFIRLAAAVLATILLAGCRAGEPGPGDPEPVAPPLSSIPATAEERARAAELFAAARAAFDAGEVATSRRLAEQVVEQYPGAPSSSPALWLAARAAFELEDFAAAAAMAERYAGLFPGGAPGGDAARELAERAHEAIEAASAPTAVIGVILPRSGSPVLRQYGDLILEGVRLAIEREAAGGGANIELVVVDDAGDASRDSAVVAGLERRGAVGVIGPLLTLGMAAAARGRSRSGLAIVSPTASDVAPGQPNVYSLSAGDTRGAELLARYAARTGAGRVALLYPRVAEFERQARAFTRSLTAAGGIVVADVPFDSGTTTFAEQVRGIAAASPQAVFIPASERDVRQIAPQLSFYGLGAAGVRILGGEAWTGEEVLRLVERQYLDGVVAVTSLHKPSGEVAWQDFVQLYETAHRRTLDNPYPALGYDAASLLISAIGGRRIGPDEVAARLAGLRRLRGATGVLSVEDGAIVRRPFLVRIEAGELVPISSGDAGALGASSSSPRR